MNENDLKDMQQYSYRDFVYKVSSPHTKSTKLLSGKLFELEYDAKLLGDSDFPRTLDFTSHLLTAALGLSGETGEFNDHVKKLLFHNKELTQDIADAMIKELGDVMWYVMQACIALDVDLHEIIQKNEEKLIARHGDSFKENYNSKEE